MKKHFLLLFLMALLPMVGWGQNVYWTDGGSGTTHKDFIFNGEVPLTNANVASLITVTGTGNRTSQACTFTAGYTWQDANSDGNLWSNCNKYNYSIHETQAAADSEDGATVVVDPNAIGKTYYVRVWARYQQNRQTNNQRGYKVLTFKIVKEKVIINAAYTYKTYGEEDPKSPLFEFDASNPTPVDKEDIEKYLVLKRVTGEVGEDVGSYLYYIDFSEDYAQKCPYDIAILQNNSNLVIQKADLHVVVTNNFKEFNHADPAPFEYTIVSGLQWDDTKDDVNATITRPGAKVTDPVNAKLDSHGEPQPLAGGETYEFAGEAANYKIIFDNKFYVVPSTNVGNINVIVKNYSVPEGDSHFNTDEFVYRGTEYTPGRGQEEKGNLIVTDGTYDLVNGKDYTVDGYKENVHVGQATVTINFVGSDSYATTEKKSANFNIVKATLTITANTYSGLVPGGEPATFGWEYAGWVNGEGTAEAPSTNPKPKDFHAPSGVTKQAVQGSTDYKLIVNHDAKAADYDIKYVDGDLIYGNTAVIVTATNTGKTYGEPDEPLPYTVLHEDGSELSLAEWAAIGGKAHPYFTIFREEGENVGEYAITFDGPTVLPEGIKITYHDGTFTIGHKTVWLKGDNTSKIYGDANPTFDATVYETRTGNAPNYSYSNPWDADKKAEEGVINPDFYYVGVEDAVWNGREWVLASENVTPGDDYYAVTPTVRGNGITKSGRGNYRVVVSGVGKFTITPAPLTIQADDKVKMYGQPDPEFTATVTGLKRNDRVVKDVDYQVYRSNPDLERNNEIGQYTIYVAPKTTPVTAVLKNYDITWTNGKLTIEKMNLLVVAGEQAVNYGEPINPYKAQVYYILGENEYREAGWDANTMKKVFSLEADVTKVGATKDAYTLVDANNTNYNLKEFTNNWLTVNPLKTIPLDENALAEITEQPLKKVLDDHKGLTLDVTLPARKMQKDDWYAWVLPFEVTQRAFFNDEVWGYGAMEVLDKTKTTDKSVTFSLVVYNSIPANTPFIVKIDNTIERDKMSDITFEGVTIAPNFDYINNVPTSGSEDQVQFIGVYEETTLGAGTRVLARQTATSPNEFWNGEGATIFSTYAYLQFPTENAAREAKIFIEDPNGGGTTEISGVKSEANSMNAEGWYNLNGVKMEGAPAQKGVYIKDGKKVVIK